MVAQTVSCIDYNVMRVRKQNGTASSSDDFSSPLGGTGAQGQVVGILSHEGANWYLLRRTDKSSRPPPYSCHDDLSRRPGYTMCAANGIMAYSSDQHDRCPPAHLHPDLAHCCMYLASLRFARARCVTRGDKALQQEWTLADTRTGSL
jgi:hypothetical protein